MTADVFTHPWLGGLFGDPEVSAIWSPDRQIADMLRVEAAYSRAIGSAGMVPPAKAERAGAAIEACAVYPGDLRDGTRRDGVPVPDLVRLLKAAAGKDADAVHSGMTSQDVMDTALALTLRDINDLLARRLTALSGALSNVIAQYGDVDIMGRTRMQAALPIRFGHRAATWSAPLASYSLHLAALRPQIERLQLGGAVGDRSALGPSAPEIAAKMAELLGLNEAPVAWHTQRGPITEYASFLSLVTGTLGKMGQDICLMSQQGIDDLQISGGGGSSAMPHKQNPVIAELMVTLARYNATQISGMHHALIHEQERSGAAWSLEWMILPQMSIATSRSLAAAQELCARISIPNVNAT